MTTENNKVATIELMAPAGSYEAMMAAIQAGCNSVYFGIEQLNMRARSTNNFSLADLDKIAEIGRTHKVKTYLTLNTVLYDHDIRLMKDIVKAVKKAGITAIIAADHAAISTAFKEGVEVHISTQANVSNVETVAFYSTFADVVVLARELTLKQVADICAKIKRRNICGPAGKPIEIEIFVHGALCMAVSGKCYLSLHSHNASANRGACIQNCRRSYVVTDKEDGIEFEVDNEYIMSAKDLCTIDFIDKIIDAGVKVMKIEGRGRSADYVYTVTQCYREAIDAHYDKSFSLEKLSYWKERLAMVFNRGFWDGYYLGRKMGEWNNEYGSKATQKKIYIGKGLNYFSKLGVAEFKAESHQLKVGDKVIVMGPSSGYQESLVAELRVDDVVVEEINKGDIFSLPLAEKVRHSDKLYKIVDALDV
ncbi:MAG: peptidase U32 family protein [bacterium]|nr:peptidase U32 family protein [bacterium]